MSVVWQHFSLKSEEDVAAGCETHRAQVSRGGTEEGEFNTFKFHTFPPGLFKPRSPTNRAERHSIHADIVWIDIRQNSRLPYRFGV